MNSVRKIRLPWLAYVLAGLVAQPAAAWCDLVFKDVAPLAEIVVLAEVRKPKDRHSELVPVEVLKGIYEKEILSLDPEELVAGVKNGDQVILALTPEHTLVRDNQGLGLCSVINVLHIRDGKLRARDRQHYDSGSKALPLDQLREELIRDLSQPAHPLAQHEQAAVRIDLAR